jgi:hypothetical protein
MHTPWLKFRKKNLSRCAIGMSDVVGSLRP